MPGFSNRFDVCRCVAGIGSCLWVASAMAQEASQSGWSFFGRGSVSVHRKDSESVRAAFRPLVAKARESVVRILVDGKAVALGTLVGEDGTIVTKASQIGAEPVCRTVDGVDHKAKVIAKDDANDIALLKIEGKGFTVASLTASKPVKAGQWAISVGQEERPLSLGVVSGPVRRIPLGVLSGRRAVLGILLAADGRVARIAQVTAGGPAAKAGLKADDIIAAVDGKSIEDSEHFRQLLSQRKIGDAVALIIKRGDESLNVSAKLADSETSLGAQGQFSDRQNRMNQMGGALSQRRGRFPAAFQHDAVLKPEDCGGPVLDVAGTVVGINISRTGRTESYAIPVAHLRKLVADLSASRSKAR